ncbi:putative metallo-beta-lactamase domain protein [Plectosphaerella plurivora]|uniref:Metallo-beta-lactamase domain protein n=1 Tax=Plectosphaerella plurivora TaxID=936078 RepID=A0A9P9AHY0_9PEZI|nr:putative metallo-beta-lactamase domain protein [Plectosphaerella plurivora]
MAPNEPIISHSFHPGTGTWQFLVADPLSKSAVIIDPVLDFDPATSTISTTSADHLLSLVKENGYNIERLLETHAHADHLTASGYLQARLAERQEVAPVTCIGKRITEVQQTFAPRYGIPVEEYRDVFDHLFEDEEVFTIGSVEAKVMHLPGHTPDHIGYLVGGNLFCGDSLFNADVGSARCDFPGGNAHDLYVSVRKVLDLPGHYKLWTGHDYPPGGEGRKDPLPYQTVEEQREKNKHLRKGVVEEEFVTWRSERDGGLGQPRLLHYALQVNVRGGRLPRPNSAGDRLLQMPLKMTGSGW